MNWVDENAAAQALRDRTATVSDLREIVLRYPALRPAVALYPDVDPPLLGWLAELNDPQVSVALGQRAAAGATGVSVAAPANNRRALWLSLAGAAVLVLVLAVAAALVLPGRSDAGRPQVPTATGGPSTGSQASDALRVSGTAPARSAWAEGYQVVWRLSGESIGLSSENRPYFLGRTDQQLLLGGGYGDGRVVAVTTATGRARAVDTNGYDCGGPLDDARLLCGSAGGSFDLLDPGTGASSPITGWQPGGGQAGSGWVQVADGGLVGLWSPEGTGLGDEGDLVRISDDGSTARWRSTFEQSDFGVPVRRNHGVFVDPWQAIDDASGTVLADNSGTWDTQWAAAAVIHSTTAAQPFTGPDGVVVRFTSLDTVAVSTASLPTYPLTVEAGVVTAHDPSTEEPVWSTPTGLAGDADSVVVAHHDGLLALVMDQDHAARVVVLDEESGSLLWQGGVRGDPDRVWTFFPTFTADGTLIVEGEVLEGDSGWVSDGRLTAFDADRGTVLWTKVGILTGSGDPVYRGLEPLAEATERFSEVVVDNLDGSVSLLAPAASASRDPTPPAAVPACPAGMKALAWSRYADGSILLCQAGEQVRLVFDDPARPDWAAETVEFAPTGYTVTFSGDRRVTVEADGALVSADDGGVVATWVADQSWTAATGAGDLQAAAGVRSCPAGSWPLSLSTWQGGWLLVCGTGAGPSLIAWADPDEHPGESGEVSSGPFGYCAETGSGEVCADGSRVRFGHSDGSGTVRTATGQWAAGELPGLSAQGGPDRPDLSGSWITVLKSVSTKEDIAVARAVAGRISDRYGVRPVVIDSDEYPSLRPGWWAVVLVGFDTNAQARAACATVGRTPSGACYGRRIP